jgi:hypothetical protein
MKFVSRLDFGLLMVLALCLFTLIPLAANPGLPNGTDVLYHVYRAAEMDRAWAHGVLLPQWAEGLYYGYGSPLFHYYASLTYYLTSLITRLFGFDAVNSLRMVIALCMFGGGAGMYWFMKARAESQVQLGTLAGVLAAVCYVYSPYLLYTEPYARGDYPELLAFALFPWVMGCFERLLEHGRARNMLLSALGIMLLILAHNLMALVLSALLVTWLAWEVVWEIVAGKLREREPKGVQGKRSSHNSPTTTQLPSGIAKNPEQHRYIPHLLAFAAFALGVGLAAYFWLPVILEHNEVKLENLTAVALLDYRNFFLSPGELLAFTPRADGGAIDGLLHQLNFGVAQWALALVGLLGVVGTRYLVSVSSQLRSSVTPLFRQTLFFALFALMLIILMLPTGIWDGIAVLRFLQFPWRLLGPAAFCLAVLAGMNAVWIEQLPGRWAGAIIAGMVALPVALALPLLYVPEWVHRTVDTSIAAYQQSEVLGLQRGTTFTNEYLPRHVDVLADSTNWLLDEYAVHYAPGGDGMVDKANRARIPADATVELLDHHPQEDRWRVVAQTPFVMEVLTHDFAGWRAEIDGQPVEITPSNPHGFINFPVPAGEHTIRVVLGSTPPRDLGVALTILSALGLAGAMIYVGRYKMQQTRYSVSLQPAWRWGMIAGVIVSLALAILLLREGIAWVKSPPGKALVAQHQVTYHLGDKLELIGYDLNGDSFHPGGRVDLAVYWYARDRLPYNYQSFVHISTGGPPLAQADLQNPAGRPTTTWTSDGYIRDEYPITLPETMPPGDYKLLIGLYTCETLPAGQCGNGDRLPVSDAQGKALGDAALLQSITVR